MRQVLDKNGVFLQEDFQGFFDMKILNGLQTVKY
jgi:hypothetical protein